MTQPPDPSAAQAAAPEQLESPPQTTDEPTPAFGWTPYAERINGRFAMVGFIALLLIEWFTRQDFFTWLGF